MIRKYLLIMALLLMIPAMLMANDAIFITNDATTGADVMPVIWNGDNLSQGAPVKQTGVLTAAEYRQLMLDSSYFTHDQTKTTSSGAVGTNDLYYLFTREATPTTTSDGTFDYYTHDATAMTSTRTITVTRYHMRA